SIVSSNAAEFAITASTCDTINAGGSCTIAIAFRPSAAGTRTGTVTITSNATGSPHRMTLSGSGVAIVTQGKLSSVAATSFPGQMLGTTSGAKTITLTNVGGGPVAVQSIVSSNSSEFAITSSSCGTINVGSSCSFALTFRPVN